MASHTDACLSFGKVQCRCSSEQTAFHVVAQKLKFLLLRLCPALGCRVFYLWPSAKPRNEWRHMSFKFHIGSACSPVAMVAWNNGVQRSKPCREDHVFIFYYYVKTGRKNWGELSPSHTVCFLCTSLPCKRLTADLEECSVEGWIDQWQAIRVLGIFFSICDK